MRIPPQTFLFTVFLGALGAILPLSIDMGLPALGAVSQALATTPAMATLTLSVFLAGFALAPILLGPLSDQYGRRPVLLAGTAVFTLAGLACAAAPTIEVLLGGRLIQGAGAGAGLVSVLAIVRDLFTGPLARARLAYVRVVQTIAPMVAPTLGAWVLALLGWRGIYGTLAVSGALLFLVILFGFEESSSVERRTVFRPATLLRNYGRVARHPVAMGYVLVNAFSFGALFAYISGSPLVMMSVFRVAPERYGLLFACTAFAIMAGAFLSGRLSTRGVAPEKMLVAGLWGTSLAVVLLSSLTLTGHASVATLMPLLVLATFSVGLIFPNASHGVLEPLPDIAGAASALLSFIQMGCGSLAGALVATFYDGHSPLAMIGVMTGFALLALAVYYVVVRPAENPQRAAA